MNKIVLFYDELIILPNEFLSQFNSYSYNSKSLTNEILKKSKCEILLSRSTIKVNEDLLNGVPLKFYATATAGSDHIDFNYLIQNNINYYVADGCNSNSVAEYVLINLNEYLNHYNKTANELTIGIIGFGNIGKKLAFYSKLLGFNVLVNDPPLEDSNYNFPDYIKVCNLEYLLSHSDIITNHVPLILKNKYITKNLLAENLNLLKDNSMFIHCSRGSIVSEEKLIEIGNKKKLYLVIDVWDNEPKVNLDLVAISNCATPHIAGHSYNAKVNSSNMIINKLYELKMINEFYELKLVNNELTNQNNIKSQIKKASIERKIKEDSILFKENPNSFQEIRSKYPKRYENLNI